MRTMYRAKAQFANASAASVDSSYKKLPFYLREFAEFNLGTIAFAEKDENSRFKRAIVVPSVFCVAQVRQRVVGIDCTHSKCPSYDGVQMLLVGRDGDLQNVTLAFALVPAEDLES